MPEKEVLERARKDEREGKSPSTQAGEFVREEIDHVREGKHGARSVKQAIAIGLSKARRAGIDLPVPKKGTVSAKVRRDAQRVRDENAGRGKASRKPSAKRSRSSLRALQHESTASASRRALSQQAVRSAAKRGSAARHRAAEKAAITRRGSSSHRNS
jgi:hypothetical protein